MRAAARATAASLLALALGIGMLLVGPASASASGQTSGAAPSVSQTASRPALTLRSPTRQVLVGQRIRLEGTAARSLRGTTVVIESQASPWRRVATARVDQRGRFAVAVRASISHRVLRVRAAGRPVARPFVSAALRLDVHRPVATQIRLARGSHPVPSRQVTIEVDTGSADVVLRLWRRASPTGTWRRVASLESPWRFGNEFQVDLPRGHQAFRVDAVSTTKPSIRLGWSNTLAYDVRFRDAREPAGDIRRLPSPPVPADGPSERLHSSDGAYVVREVVEAGGTSSALYRWSRATGRSELITRAADGSPAPGRHEARDVSTDGRYVVYTGPGEREDGAQTTPTVGYLWDAHDGVSRPILARQPFGGLVQRYVGDLSVSDDGARVLYSADLVDPDNLDAWTYDDAAVFVWEAATGDSRLVTRTADGAPDLGHHAYLQLTPDGRYATFASRSRSVSGDGGFRSYRHDLTSSTVEVVSPREGSQPRISDDGARVVFRADRSIGVWDRATGETTWLPLGDAVRPSWQATISGDGEHVVFSAHSVRVLAWPTNATVFVEGVFRYTLRTGELRHISQSAGGRQIGDGFTLVRGVSRDGSQVLLEDPAVATYLWTGRS